MNKQLDFTAAEEKAKNLSVESLWYAIFDIRKTLPLADAADREYGTNDGGYYRDEASVYHRELVRRNKK